MEIKAVVKFRGEFAEYRITKENDGIYSAILEKYDGSIHLLPPPHITLTKSVRHWRGSTDEQTLIDELGDIIEINAQSGILFSK